MNDERNKLYNRIKELESEVRYWQMEAEHNEAVIDAMVQVETNYLYTMRHEQEVN